MRIQVLWTGVRRFLLWAIPGVLVAVLIWTLLPRPGAVPPPRQTASGDAVGGAPPPGDAAMIDASPTGSAPAAPPAPPAPASPAPQATRGSAAPYAEIRQGDLVGTDDTGRSRWRIIADNVTVEQGKRVVIIQGVRATFYSQDGTTMTITGRQGRYDTGTREIDLAGAVHGMSSNGRQLFADRLHWTPSSGLITGIGHVRLLEERVIMYADRMISSIALSRTQFFGNVHVAVR